MNDALKGSETFLFKSAVALKACCAPINIRKFSLAKLTWEAFRFLIVTYSYCGGVESSLVSME